MKINRVLFILLLMALIVSGCRVHEAKNGNDSNRQNVVFNLFGIVVQDNSYDTTSTNTGAQEPSGGGGWFASFLGFAFVVIGYVFMRVYNHRTSASEWGGKL